MNRAGDSGECQKRVLQETLTRNLNRELAGCSDLPKLTELMAVKLLQVLVQCDAGDRARRDFAQVEFIWFYHKDRSHRREEGNADGKGASIILFG